MIRGGRLLFVHIGEMPSIYLMIHDRLVIYI